MNKTIQLNAAKVPRMIGDLVHSNQFLKVFSVGALSVALLTLMVLIMTVSRPPVILTLAANGQSIDTTESAKAEDQIRAAITQYLDLRYKWTPQNVKQRLTSARAFVLAKNAKAFDAATANVAKFASEKAVSQKIYPDKIEVDLKQATISVSGDRVTSIQGLKAAGDLKLQLTFASGERTKTNPWGLYITKEREE